MYLRICFEFCNLNLKSRVNLCNVETLKNPHEVYEFFFIFTWTCRTATECTIVCTIRFIFKKMSRTLSYSLNKTFVCFDKTNISTFSIMQEIMHIFLIHVQQKKRKKITPKSIASAARVLEPWLIFLTYKHGNPR